ncbi:hypothetical protein [Dyadobacter sp. CY356]|uniref:hypothetical protein n=1 Tax=Dyadobacter sp. CY356 TaxID=2906442 RepID=UPI001F3155E3|nr:hypothetical protein [Dyadobacter sp. CY356]MCF0055134.1 hypothetical protein [Dyadobacter sp. CY356]
MKQSNIFVYIELSKMVGALSCDGDDQNLKKTLLKQSAYFRIIEPKLFPQPLQIKWEKIIKLASYKGVKQDADGRIVLSAFANTIGQWSAAECKMFVDSIVSLLSEVKKEFA